MPKIQVSAFNPPNKGSAPVYGLRQFNIANFIAALKATGDPSDLATAKALDALVEVPLTGTTQNFTISNCATFIFGRGTDGGGADLVVNDKTNQLPVTTPGTLVGWLAIADTVPTGADIHIDITLNGATIFGATEVVIPAGDGTVQSGAIFVTPAVKINVKDILQGVVDQVGSTAAGQSVTVVLFWQ